MYKHKFHVLAALVIACATPAASADFSDPEWPCIQRKVDRLSAGLMWPAPLPETPVPDTLEPAVDELSQLLALRRVTLDEARAAVTEFAAANPHDEAVMGEVFARVFDSLSKRRTRIIDGIGDFSLGQIALSERIDAARAEMDSAMAAAEPDFDRVDVLEEQLDWDSRIFSDRQKTITYLCETPTLLEKRLYSIAQILSEAARTEG